MKEKEIGAGQESDAFSELVLLPPPLDSEAVKTISPRRSRLLKVWECPVELPDGSRGLCRYERDGPTFHRFRFDREVEGMDRPQYLASPYFGMRLENTPEAIEKMAQEMAPKAFAIAVEREMREYFGRATESHERTADKSRFQMSAARAKEVGGKYALCIPLGEGERLIPTSPVFASLSEANAAWRERGDVKLVVACGNRLDRCWERPRLNALYKQVPDMAPKRRT